MWCIMATLNIFSNKLQKKIIESLDLMMQVAPLNAIGS